MLTLNKGILIGFTGMSVYLFTKVNKCSSSDGIAFATGLATFAVTKLLESKPSNLGKLLLII